MPPPARAVVISNCQARDLAAALNQYTTGTHFRPWAVNQARPAQREQVIAGFVDRVRADTELVVAVELSPRFHGLQIGQLRQSFAGIPVVTISNMYFAGLHPDVTYVGGMGNRLAGPMGDYHSKLALHAFLRGKTPDHACTLFRDDVFRTAGYYEAYAASLATLVQRDATVEVKVTDILPAILRQARAFYTLNHPTAAVFAPYAGMIVDHLAAAGLVTPSGASRDPAAFACSLARGSIFPVYPPVAACHGVPELGSYEFRRGGDDPSSLDLAAFVEAEFAAFAQRGAAELARRPVGRSVLEMFAFL